MLARNVGIRWRRLGSWLALAPLATVCGNATDAAAPTLDAPQTSTPAFIVIESAKPLASAIPDDDSAIVPTWGEEGTLFDPPPSGPQAVPQSGNKDRRRTPAVHSKKAPWLPQKPKPSEPLNVDEAPRLPATRPTLPRTPKAPVQKPEKIADERRPNELHVDSARPLASESAEVPADGRSFDRSARPAPTRQAPRPTAASLRSREMEAVSRRAELHVARGHDLAARGATYSARAEFIQALRVVAQALDALHDTNEHGAALAAGLRALDECDDFLPRGSQLDADIDVAALAAGHRTPVLEYRTAQMTPPLVAVQQYLTYAQNQLGFVAANEPAGSMALYGMGKLLALQEEKLPGAVPGAEPKAMAFYQAALVTHPGNYQAANELAVLVARTGQLERARDLLQQAVSFAPRPELWKNLAVVHKELGESSLARQADRQAQVAAASPRGSSGVSRGVPPVQWVNASEMAARTQPIDNAQAKVAPKGGDHDRRMARRDPPADAEPTDPPAPAAEQPKGFRSWFPWWTR